MKVERYFSFNRQVCAASSINIGTLAVRKGGSQRDLSGKQVYLFCSHGTGGLASSVKDISAVLPDTELSDNVFDVYEEDAASAEEEIAEWLESIGM